MKDFLLSLLQNEVLVYALMAFVPLVFVIPFALFAVWWERKISAHMQDRLGPMRTGAHGWLQTVADIAKLIQKEDIIPTKADRMLFILAPYIVFAASYAAYAAIPFSAAYVGSNINIGLFFVLSITSVAVVGLLMAGWASNNKWSLFGAFRSAAQIVSYEIPAALAVITVVMVTGTFDLQEINRQQSGFFLTSWYAFRYPPLLFLAGIIYFVASLSEVNRTPFDIPEAESELVGGYHTEYGGMRFALLFLSEYSNMFAVSAIAATLFLGGWNSPFGDFLSGPWLGFGWFTLKGLGFIFVQMWLRWTLPRLRVDQLMVVGWKVLVPFSFVLLLGVGLWVMLVR
jgi:NADH-quinone oxidoreductase subunit H